MTIKKHGGIFGRNPTFNNVALEGNLNIPDAKRLKLGDNGEFYLIHQADGTSRIEETGSGSLAIKATNLFLRAANDKLYMLCDDNAEVILYYDGNQKFATRADGVGVTGNVVLASGNGIDFSATAGTGTSELLDDYEEGTFTPAVVGASTAGTFTYSTQYGKYTKVGNIVHVQITIIVSATATAAVGNLAVTGLPFAIDIGSNEFASFAIGWSQNVTFNTQICAYGADGLTQMNLRSAVSGGSGNLITGGNLGSAFYLLIGGSYQTT